ncbi:hotdog family protein [Paenibacillus apiarius]|uniref:Beta-hydroxyacyl-ACP dehydratase n=1 Tax=Paenibacillus apiarius TaxID=46240 RepID=A0ABT4DVP1_9BACL|nr:beta-hydroxyacyl-ACP dehydratase [Paenibacillus apiarius]MCY9513218.1 beta-hydroxyacyl-ACP dehydratase [Paenibacillus apiarius]MCY9521423.1 beta-hydroxyacyl-ACP dehydratase [Paenibacillus apiarius]MCY9554431.1 beta-hydroxyacyl-ACP dehydratase [Paenibacillus apiarius]MCY9560634.1 beta-hydroxyacyl-ACP dehydratase [Paenibacillus apiarius]MCY9685115.1 beta-hydroxyacyl-ACP dehydratase [Paenibacillus apiarius]
MDINEITSVLPHRYPFLMVDRVSELEPGKWVKGYKNVTPNEWFMNEAQPHMPGTMIVEALAQLGAFATTGSGSGLGFLSSLKGVEMTGMARPGDRVHLYYEVIRHKKGFTLGRGQASVEGNVIVKVGELMFYTAPSDTSIAQPAQ